MTDQELAQRVADAANALTDAATAASDAGLVVQLDVCGFSKLCHLFSLNSVTLREGG